MNRRALKTVHSLHVCNSAKHVMGGGWMENRRERGKDSSSTYFTYCLLIKYRKIKLTSSLIVSVSMGHSS